MPSKLKKALGAVKDQTSISLAKVASNTSSNLEVAVLKATTHDDVPIDERYVREVVELVSSNKAYAKACARAIGKRIGRTRNWIVALKSLMLVLRIFQDGDPYFPRETLHAMKRGAKILNLSGFRDDSNSSPWDYTAFVRTFALYLDERLDCFLTGKLQRRFTTHREIYSPTYPNRKPNEPVRDMKPAMLLDKLSYWQRLLERAIATRPTGPAKMNRLVQVSLLAVVQESFDLYKDISEGLTLILDSFFHLQYQSCVNAFQTCVKASKQFEELEAFYSLCKSIGIARISEYPSVQTISDELIETLQEFLKDKSSFPATSRSPNRALMPPPAPNSGLGSDRRGSYGGLSEFSMTTATTTEGYSSRGPDSEWGSRSEFSSRRTSLEDLISATETGRSPSISIDLEAYGDQFEKKSLRDDAFRLSETGSTHSLPASTSIADLVSLDNWPEVEEGEKEQDKSQDQEQKQDECTPNSWELVLAETLAPSPPHHKQQQPPLPNTAIGSSFNPFPDQENPLLPLQQQQEQKQDRRCRAQSWELVLAEAIAPSIQTLPNAEAAGGFDAFSYQQQQPKAEQSGSEDYGSRTGWELALVEPATQSTPNMASSFSASSLDYLYNQPSNYYNPFLQDTPELPALENFQAAFPTNDAFGSAPTFQAAPTFSAQNPNVSTTLDFGDDPFASPLSSAQSGEQMVNGSVNQQQNLLQEQQLWLQQQNKIIAKHMA